MNDYSIDLLNRHLCDSAFHFAENDAFFEEIGGVIVRGEVETEVVCTSATQSFFRFSVRSKGRIFVPCDRCLADVELRVDTNDELLVKLGDDYSDDGDIVTVPEEGVVDISQNIYEFIALGIPMKCVHEPGKCDSTMIEKLGQYQVASRSDHEDDDAGDSLRDDGIPIDKRWDALKKIVNNNNN